MKRFWMVSVITLLVILTGIPATQAGDTPRMTFAVLSDIHIQSWHLPAQNKLRTALRDLASNFQLDALVINGDLTNGRAADYHTLQNLLAKEKQLPVQQLYTIGNHEFYQAFHERNGRFSKETFPNGETDEQAIQRFLQFAGRDKIYGEAQVKGLHFLLLGSEGCMKRGREHMDNACLSQTQLDWLDQKLRAAETSADPVFVFLHQPLGHTVVGTDNWWAEAAVEEGQKLRKILTQRPNVFLFSSHTHHALGPGMVDSRSGFTAVATSSVAKPARRALADSQGVIVEVYDDKVVLKGRDFHHHTWVQRGIYPVPLTPSK